ncbi:MAG: porin [Alphaproteobacteria bacterium]|nr:porin [Alphaproteobacteria bacterium]MBU0798891.1 porin [Alphaproteobacteria bacterium]MBU0886279.1 porin [Alphaproteobacteria bacterium]MBU1813525.1 porin [Alphaproteobacteria bacterium]MBU2091826.1 porin [Alphaproteobacteria bacterium]
MKKILLGSTALVAAGLLAQPAFAADPIQLQVKGYYQNLVTYSDVSDAPAGTNYKDFQFRHEGEVHFMGKTKLDNGLTVGFDAQLEIVNVGLSGGQPRDMDETYMWLEGGFGKLQLGAENGAAYLLHVDAPSFGLGFDDRNFGPVVQTGGFSRPNIAGDTPKGTYFTPRIAGFQAGVSYSPNLDGQDLSGYGFGVISVPTGSVEDIYALGLNYTGKFGDFGLRASAGYETGDVVGGGQDPETWALGLSVAFGGFTVGGAYSDSENYNSGSVSPGADGNVYSLGLSYQTGPWGISGVYQNTDFDVAGVTTANSSDEYELAAMYQAGPGIQFRGGITYTDTDLGTVADTTTVFVGTFLSF